MEDDTYILAPLVVVVVHGCALRMQLFFILSQTYFTGKLPVLGTRTMVIYDMYLILHDTVVADVVVENGIFLSRSKGVKTEISNAAMSVNIIPIFYWKKSAHDKI